MDRDLRSCKGVEDAAAAAAADEKDDLLHFPARNFESKIPLTINCFHLLRQLAQDRIPS